MPKQFLPKVIPNENKKETAIRQQLSLEKFMAEINLQKKCFQNYLERWFRCEYDNSLCTGLQPQ